MFVMKIEEVVIEIFVVYNFVLVCKVGVLGIYVVFGVYEGVKIVVFGLKICNGCSYYGLSLNVKMDLCLFFVINLCGYVGLEIVDMVSFEVVVDWNDVVCMLVCCLIVNFDGVFVVVDKLYVLE